jgi:hypothetical protein
MAPTAINGFTYQPGKIVSELKSSVQIGSSFELNNSPDPKDRKPFIGIWDTGATKTVISKKVVQDCDLKQVGFAKVFHAQGIKDNVPTYNICIELPNGIIISSLNVIEGDLNGADVLVGMDIITLGDMVITNFMGKTVFSFRIPSVQSIDFNPNKKQQSLPSYPLVGRNDPCPCKSGKKYKKCCGKGIA